MSTLSRITSYPRAGLEFDVLDEGPIDGDVVVLLHGFPQRAASWRSVTAILHGHGLRTLAPDLRGYSPRARPRRRRDYRTQLLADDVAALLELTGPAHVVGHDWGAVVAWATAATHPDVVRSLVAVSVGHPGAFLGSMLRSDQLLRSWYMGFFQLPGVPERVLSRPATARKVLRRAGMSHAMIDEFERDVVAAGALRGGLGYYRGLPLSDLRASRKRVSAPTTMVWSDGDVALGRKGAAGSEKYVDADFRFAELPGVSHWIPDEAPEELAALILDRVR